MSLMDDDIQHPRQRRAGAADSCTSDFTREPRSLQSDARLGYAGVVKPHHGGNVDNSDEGSNLRAGIKLPGDLVQVQ